jgi:hypothetical protein
MSVSQSMIVTDIEFYGRNPDVKDAKKDLDFVEHVQYRSYLEAEGVATRSGYDIFWNQAVFVEEFKVPPVLVMTVGLFLNTNSVDTSTAQSCTFKHSMATFHKVAMDACIQQYPGALVCFVTCKRIAEIDATMNLGPLIRLPVKSRHGEHCITNVRYGELDEDKRHLEPNFMGILGGNVNAALPYVDNDGTLDVFSMVAGAAKKGKVLCLASNRFQAASALYDFAKDSGEVVPEWRDVSEVLDGDEERRFVTLKFHEDCGSWSGVTTFRELMSYPLKSCPLSSAERALYWSEGAIA